MNGRRLILTLALGAAAVAVGGETFAAEPYVTQPRVITPPPGFDPHAVQGEAYGRAVAALPDWNGVWTMNGPLIFDPATAKAEHDGREGTDFGVAPGASEDPPYNAKWEAEYRRRIKAAVEKGAVIDKVGQCSPHGMPRVIGTTPREFELVLMPKIVFMSWAYFSQVRRIYTDGRSHPDPDVSYPIEMGHSIGHWEGDTLVIDTVNMLPGNYDQTQAPYSDQVHVVERLHMRPDSQLQNDITIEDPVVFTQPWHVTRLYRRVPVDAKLKAQITSTAPGPDWAHVEQVYCTNQRNQADENGVEGVQLKSAPAARAPVSSGKRSVRRSGVAGRRR